MPSSPKRSAGRFEFTLTLKHGSWLNMAESLTCSILRHIRVMSKQELKDCIIEGHGLRQLVSGGSHLVLLIRFGVQER
jgi:hypothetical protein